jgi:hypothetical protein
MDENVIDGWSKQHTAIVASFERNVNEKRGSNLFILSQKFIDLFHLISSLGFAGELLHLKHADNAV